MGRQLIQAGRHRGFKRFFDKRHLGCHGKAGNLGQKTVQGRIRRALPKRRCLHECQLGRQRFGQTGQADFFITAADIPSGGQSVRKCRPAIGKFHIDRHQCLRHLRQMVLFSRFLQPGSKRRLWRNTGSRRHFCHRSGFRQRQAIPRLHRQPDQAVPGGFGQHRRHVAEHGGIGKESVIRYPALIGQKRRRRHQRTGSHHPARRFKCLAGTELRQSNGFIEQRCPRSKSFHFKIDTVFQGLEFCRFQGNKIDFNFRYQHRCQSTAMARLNDIIPIPPTGNGNGPAKIGYFTMTTDYASTAFRQHAPITPLLQFTSGNHGFEKRIQMIEQRQSPGALRMQCQATQPTDNRTNTLRRVTTGHRPVSPITIETVFGIPEVFFHEIIDSIRGRHAIPVNHQGP